MSQSSEFAGSGRKRERSKTEGHVSCIHRSHPARRTHTLSERQIQYWQRRALAQEACQRSPCHRCRDSHQVHGQAESRAARSDPEPPLEGVDTPLSIKTLPVRRNSPKQNAERIFGRQEKEKLTPPGMAYRGPPPEPTLHTIARLSRQPSFSRTQNYAYESYFSLHA
jgi:hypothetical protein